VMNLYRKAYISVDEYFKIRESSEEVLEYIDGAVYMTPSPSTKHQRISSRLHIKFGNFLERNRCKVFHDQIDIELKKEEIERTKIVIPDISVICNKDGLTDQRDVGVPELNVENLSPPNQSQE